MTGRQLAEHPLDGWSCQCVLFLPDTWCLVWLCQCQEVLWWNPANVIDSQLLQRCCMNVERRRTHLYICGVSRCPFWGPLEESYQHLRTVSGFRRPESEPLLSAARLSMIKRAQKLRTCVCSDFCRDLADVKLCVLHSYTSSWWFQVLHVWRCCR